VAFSALTQASMSNNYAIKTEISDPKSFPTRRPRSSADTSSGRFPDPYVYEELEHLYRGVGDAGRAEEYAAKLRASKAAQ